MMFLPYLRVGTASRSRTHEFDSPPLRRHRVGSGRDLGWLRGRQNRHGVDLRVQVLSAAGRFQTTFELAVVPLETGVRDDQVIASGVRPVVDSENN